jgi:hypothetical protein
MEDKKNKPVPEKNSKKPTGKSATGKPLDGIDINPQLDDKRRTNEDFAVLTASLQERKALTIVQRQQRARQLKRIQPKLKRAKELSQARLAGPKKLQARAEAKARAILKSRVSARKDIPYAELSTAEKIQVDTAVAKKTKLIKRIAARLLPKLRKAEFERLKSFHSGAPMQSIHTVASEEFSGLFHDLNEKSTLELVDIIENAIGKFERENNPLSITLRRMLNSTIGTDPITETLIKKAEKTGVPFSTLKEVFERGLSSYMEESNQTPEQIAFNRVNSYIAKGRAWNLDADLREEKIINEKLDNSFMNFMEDYHAGLSDATAKKREAHWKKMQKYSDSDDRAYQDAPGDKAARKKGMPLSQHTKKYHAMYGEEVEALINEAAAGLADKAKKSGVSLSILKKVYARGVAAWNTGHRPGTTPQQWGMARVNSYITKGKGTYHGADKDLREEDMNESLWANIHAKRKRIKAGSGERMRKPGEKGAPTPGALRSAREACEVVDRPPVNLKAKRKQQEVQKKIIDEGEMKPYVKPHIEKGSTKQTAWVASNKWGKKKYFGMDFKKSAEKHAGLSEDTPAQREVGTDSLAKKYKKDTPGQEKADLNETFNMAWTAGIGVTLSAEECGIKIKPAFELHPDVVDAMEEVRSADVKGVVVRTSSGKTVVRKQKANRKIIGTGNLTDGKPDDTL